MLDPAPRYTHTLQTDYNGVRFRSRLEARWALFMDQLPVEWRYEAEGFALPSGAFVPDFYLPRLEMWVEIKPNRRFATERDLRLCEELAQAQRQRVVLFAGVPGFWCAHDFRAFDDVPGDGMARAFVPFALPDGTAGVGEDEPYTFCYCVDCQEYGIEFDGRSARIKHGADCDVPASKADKNYTGSHSRIVLAAETANARRFWDPR